ncbi:MAG: hypothetical protein ACRD4I_09000, partial [Candidatus Angelobacter sp.]
IFISTCLQTIKVAGECWVVTIPQTTRLLQLMHRFEASLPYATKRRLPDFSSIQDHYEGILPL